MIITSKFQSVCPSCEVVIERGERVQWFRGAAARHEVCPSQKTAASAPVARQVSKNNKRPMPYLRVVDRDDPAIDWTAECIELFTILDGAAVRAGEGFAVVKPGGERWPLGMVSDHYKPTDHCAADRRVLSECLTSITAGSAMVFGHGYQVVYSYLVQHMGASEIGSHKVETRLSVAHDHTGKGAMRASMCLYLDGKAIGAIVTTTAMHVAAQPGIWAQNIESMIESAIVAQDAVLDLLAAADDRKLSEEDIEYLKRKGLKLPSGEEGDKWVGKSALDALVYHHEGRNERTTWGVWERRMTDDGIRGILALLPSEIGKALDASLRDKHLSCVPTKRYSSAA